MIIRFFDTETRGFGHLKDPGNGEPYGLAHYIADLTCLTLVTWQDVDLATGEIGLVQVWEVPFEPMPDMGEASFWVAFNARFDRLAWNRFYPPIPVEKCLDLAVQARASGLPEGLDRVARALGLEGKKAKAGMLRITDARIPLPARDSVEWQEFVAYGKRDTELLWLIWQRTHKLRGSDWSEWFAGERINDRGLPLDLELAGKLRDAAQVEDAAIEREMLDLCGMTPRQSVALAAWVWPRLSDEWQERKHSLNSKTVLPELLDGELPGDVRDVLELLQGAKSPAAAKADGMIRTELGGRAYGCYMFHGASTGRFSSRGVQVHNLSRPIKGVDLTGALLAGETLDAGDVRLSRALAAGLRGCIKAGPGKTLVWADWAAIEARVLPWLAFDPTGARTQGRHAERVLELFRADVGIYEAAAWGIYRLPYGSELTAEQRFAGKTAILACGFGGGLGAYQRMASAMGVKMEDDRAREIVRAWREANPWAPWFWGALEAALAASWASPGVEHRVGRVAYRVAGKDLMCRLPGDRQLIYRNLRRSTETDQWGRRRVAWSYERGGGRVKVYGGKLSENVTQAVAADLLRGALVLAGDRVVGSVHDEIILEVPEGEAEAAGARLKALMETAPGWACGLPLKAEVKTGCRYGK